MKEVGIDISTQEAKDVRAALQERFAYVVGVGDESKERCPVFPFAFRLLRWSLEDPRVVDGSTETRLDAFRRVRNQIEPRVRDLLKLASSDKMQASLAR
jgi:arsenate reductase